MPKLLQINSARKIGSTGKIVEQIGLLAQDRGWDCYVASSSRYSGKSAMKEITIGGKFSEKLHAVISYLFDAHGLGSVWETKRLIRKIRVIKPDVIHLHNIHGYYINYPILFRYLASEEIPVVWTFHDCWPITGHCVHYTAVHCEKWKTGCYSCPRLKGYPKSVFKDNSKSNFLQKRKYFTSLNNLTIVPVSNWLERVVKQSFMGHYPIHVIQNGIDIDAFSPQNRMKKQVKAKFKLEDKFVVLGVATGWSQDNGFYFFMELRKKLDKHFIIVLVGVTSSQKKHLPEGVIGIERTDSVKELAEIYSAADIFVNGSFEETFGLVTAEAMACGTPVIVYDATACPDIVTPETGFVIPVNDIETMANTVISYSKCNKQEEYSINCRRYAEQHFDQRDCYNKYIDLYTSLLG